MLITKTQCKRKTYVKDYNTTKYDDSIHREIHIITTYWFLFIPIYRDFRLVGDNM